MDDLTTQMILNEMRENELFRMEMRHEIRDIKIWIVTEDTRKKISANRMKFWMAVAGILVAAAGAAVPLLIL